jgi:hypothetical protein
MDQVEFAKFAKSPKRIWIRFWHGHGQDEIQPGERALHGSRIRSSAVKCGWLPEPKAIAGAFANLAPHIVQLAHDRENSLCAAGSATTPVSLAVRRSRAVALPKSPKLKVFQQLELYANTV